MFKCSIYMTINNRVFYFENNEDFCFGNIHNLFVYFESISPFREKWHFQSLETGRCTVFIEACLNQHKLETTSYHIQLSFIEFPFNLWYLNKTKIVQTKYKKLNWITYAETMETSHYLKQGCSFYAFYIFMPKDIRAVHPCLKYSHA